MIVDEAISKFENACVLPINRNKIWNAVHYQYNRTTWQLYDRVCLIKISENGDAPSIEIIPYAYVTSIQYKQFDISMEQYQELKDVYFKNAVLQF